MLQRTAELEALLIHAPIGFATFDREYRYLRINNVLCDINGLPVEAHLGRTVAEVLPNVPGVAGLLEQVFTTGKSVQIEVTGETAKQPGVTRYWLAGYYPVLGEEQDVAAAGVFVIETTERKRAEDQLRTSEAEFRATFEQAAVGKAQISAKTGRFIRVNAEYCRITGYSAGELAGMKPLDLTFAEDRAVEDTWITLMLRGEISFYESEKRYVRKDGEIVWVRVNVTLLSDADGHPDRTLAVIQDITEPKRTGDAARRLSAIVESSADAIVSKDLNGIITSWNKSAERMFGYTAAEAVGQPITIVIPPDHLDEEPQILERVKRGELIDDLETVRQRKDGSRIEVALTISPVRDGHGKIVGASKIVRDLTGRMRIERNLRVANDDLKQFAYAAAHDLREPLRNVRAYSELLASLCADGPDGKIARFKNVIAEGVLRMDDLLFDLLEYTRLAADEENPGTVDCRSAYNKAIQNLRTAIGESGAQVSCGALPAVQGKEAQYVQLFQNLIANAIKYRGTDPPVIAVSAREHEGQWLFSVRDNGMGIEPEYHEQIFGIFKRLHGNRIPGTGIGLAICRKIVERYGGRIWVESQLDQGSEFFFTVPFYKSK